MATIKDNDQDPSPEERAAAEAAAQDAFEESFGPDTPPQPAAEASSAPAPSPAPAPAPSPAPAAPKKDSQPPSSENEPATDPYAGLPKEVRDRLALVDDLKHRFDSLNGRFLALQRERAAAPAPAPAASAPALAPAPAEAKKRAKLEAIRAELPEVAEALEEARAELAEEMAELRKLRAEPAPAPAAAPSPAGTADARTPDEKLLDAEQPDWIQKFSSTDFALWLTTQPPAYAQQVRSTEKAADVVAALAKFDVYTARLKAQRDAEAEVATRTTTGRSNRVAAAASTPRGNARPASTNATEDPETAFIEGFEKG